MAISLTQIIAALEAKSNATDSSTAISEILRLTQASEKVSDGKIIYDSAGVMPTDSAFIGTLAATSVGTIYFYNGTAWNAVDSAETITIPYSFQGSVSGYLSGGATPQTNVIQKFSFTSDANATDVGDLIETTTGAAGQSSSTHGYSSGGVGASSSPATTGLNTIQKYPFTVDANATDVGDLTVARWNLAGQSSSISGYSSGGQTTNSNVIDKFPFSTDANATDVGDLTVVRYSHSGQSSSNNGYISGGRTPAGGTYSNNIEKFSFSVDGNSSDVGDLTIGRQGTHGGQSSDISGYTSGGQDTGVTVSNVIDKFPFSTDANATDVGDLSVTRYNVSGNSSTTNGYTAGGFTPPLRSNVIDKFPFASDANATDVGDLLSTLEKGAGTQV